MPVVVSMLNSYYVIPGGFGGAPGTAAAGQVEARPVKTGSAEDAAFILGNAESVMPVLLAGPGLDQSR